MCGIIGYAGKENAHSVLIDGLKALEYRGYDSSGLAVFNNGKVKTLKAKGKIKNLEALLDNHKCTCGIAHTRWATHGVPSTKNAHPHTAGKITLVHNGIIENANELRNHYQQLGITFYSETDTETAAVLINDLLHQGLDMIHACLKADEVLQGSYAFAILNEDEPETIYALRRDSPLILGVGQSGNYLASDVSAFLNDTNKIIELQEHEAVCLKKDQLIIMNAEGIVQRQWKISERKINDLHKGGFDSYLLKEISEQPQVVERTFNAYLIEGLAGLKKQLPDFDGINFIYFTACGSALHAGMIAKHWMEKMAHIRCACEAASEFRYGEPQLDEHTLVVLISQSGETADTLAALRMCRRREIKTAAIVNVAGSSIAKEAEYCLPTWAGSEISVATTKAYTCQLAVLALLCIHASLQRGLLSNHEQKQIMQDIKKLPDCMRKMIKDDQINQFAEMIGDAHDVFFIGRGIDYAQSLEGSLKLKEVSYIHSEAYAAGELKHGTISLIEEGTPVLSLITSSSLAEKTYSNMAEVKARGACVLLAASENLIKDQAAYDALLNLPLLHPLLEGILSIIPYQRLAYLLAKKRGCDLDQPRNLAKSVTVE